MPMRRIFTAVVGCMAFIITTLAQTPEYGKILFRVNSGGNEKSSIDTSSVSWITDNLTNPCPYIDTVAMGNKASATEDSVAFDASVPSTTPYQVFKTDRGFMRWDINTLEFNFPVETGKTVEVRLYFAEIYFDSPDIRIFDILLENNLVLNDFDIYASHGKNVGVMKSFQVVSDGNLDIDLKRVKQQPVISAIEIIEVKSGTIAGVFSGKTYNNSASVYPNPFPEKFIVESVTTISELKVFDYAGKEIEALNIQNLNNGYVVDLSSEPKGIYFLQYFTRENNIEMKKIVKY